MAYDGRVLRQATLRFDEDKQRRQEQQRQRQQQVYQQCPELESIQREIRGTMGEIIASALRRGTDPLPAIRVIICRKSPAVPCAGIPATGATACAAA